MTQTLSVQLAHCSYPIHVSSGSLSRAGEFLPDDVSQFVVISDSEVARLYGAMLDKSITELGAPTNQIVVAPGEASKSIGSYSQILAKALSFGADRQAVIVALGGGVVGDLAGFVAATYMRGIRLIQIPTTLLAQVDSSVGGKVGINLPDAKNCVGAFYQPSAVIIDPTTLESLDEANFTSGLAEVVKYGVIMDPEFFEFLESNVGKIKARDRHVLESTIASCCQLKADVVQDDEKETSGRRAILNFGHTFAHAIESCFGYGQFLHGHAVGIGMVAAARLAESLNRVDRHFVDRVTNLLKALDVPTGFPTDKHDEMLVAMHSDKKNRDGKINFVLPTRLGHVELASSVGESLVRNAMSG